MNQYSILNIIGQGAFGNAYLATHVQEQQTYVIKKVELTGKNKEQIENIYNQVKLLEQFQHVNIVSYRQSIKEGQQLNIVMEYCHGGDMNQLIVEQKEQQGGKKLEEKKIVDWAVQIALAIFYMHDRRILHRDLKTPNIFIIDNKVKLGDFGISKVLDEKMDLASTSIGTPYYMSPEQYKHKPYSYKSDMWAFGCILYEMCNQKRPFQAYSLNGLAVKVLQANFPPVSQFYGKELRELIGKMLQKKEKERPSILQFLQAPLIKKKATAYLKEVYKQLTTEGEKVLIQGVQYQAKKLGIVLGDRKQETQKKTKPEFSAQKKKQEKERIRQQLQDELKRMSEETSKKKKILQQHKINQQHKKKVEKERNYGMGRRASHSSSNKSFKEPTTTTAESRQTTVASKVEQKAKPFQMQQKYDMYDMQFQAEVDSEEERNAIPQADNEEQIDEKPQERVEEAKPFEKKDKHEKRVEQTKPFELVEQTKPQAVVYEKQKYLKPIKETKIEASRFTQVVQQNPSKDESQVPIEEAINHLKESIKNNIYRENTIKNQISAIDFTISSSSEDQLQKTVDKPELLPAMKKKRDLNPIHVTLSDKANDLKQSLQQLLPRKSVGELLVLAKAKGSQVGRGEIERVTGSRLGAYHLAFEWVRLNAMLQRVPLYS